MSKTEGEYELVLGNRQLLSAFFIIVILFGVFFTMGYVVGRNSAPATAASPMPVPVATSQRPEAASPPPVQSPASPSQTAAPAETPAPSPVQETKESKPPAAVETKPVTPAKREVPPPKSEARVEPAPPARTSARPASASGAAVALTPGPGKMYLQVAAAAQPQAGVVVDTLKGKGFPALLAQGPNATLFRVMVGPFSDAASLGKAKAELENAGFRPLVRK
ncbi:MAG: SPOR domain-containing protein [Acidobacteriia bacterium]|nr:SPOR domain-containing protein [Terriglobia bacterium]